MIRAWSSSGTSRGASRSAPPGPDDRGWTCGRRGAATSAKDLVAGKGLGVLVLLLDALRGRCPCSSPRSASPPGSVLPAAVGLAAFAGHVAAPPWLGFRGGKGVATALGVLRGAPRGAASPALTYGVVFALLRISSVGSLLAGAVATTVAWWSARDSARCGRAEPRCSSPLWSAPGEHRPAAPPG